MIGFFLQEPVPASASEEAAPVRIQWCPRTEVGLDVTYEYEAEQSSGFVGGGGTSYRWKGRVRDLVLEATDGGFRGIRLEYSWQSEKDRDELSDVFFLDVSPSGSVSPFAPLAAGAWKHRFCLPSIMNLDLPSDPFLVGMERVRDLAVEDNSFPHFRSRLGPIIRVRERVLAGTGIDQGMSVFVRELADPAPHLRLDLDPPRAIDAFLHEVCFAPENGRVVREQKRTSVTLLSEDDRNHWYGGTMTVHRIRHESLSSEICERLRHAAGTLREAYRFLDFHPEAASEVLDRLHATDLEDLKPAAEYLRRAAERSASGRDSTIARVYEGFVRGKPLKMGEQTTVDPEEVYSSLPFSRTDAHRLFRIGRYAALFASSEERRNLLVHAMLRKFSTPGGSQDSRTEFARELMEAGAADQHDENIHWGVHLTDDQKRELENEIQIEAQSFE